ncbi:Root phototropism protein, putative [Ricinus communis]|uniref:Root phototropism protein, putative n=1 Tax=Ricinus communis TaxID=3988 RepID=B9SZ41_RICCO|nr:Root phototropism protein, putative [Ricinus communis]|eukprot:XP_015582145.2 BTB/POZ domain-containing protein DOT3 isoform X1 [Ricinus communis]
MYRATPNLSTTRTVDMKKSRHVVRSHSSESDSDGVDQDHGHDKSIIIPTKVVATTDIFEKKEDSWFVTSQIPTDLSVQVQDITFTVHKYPLVSKCGYIGRLELQPSISNFGYELKLENFPGGSEAFEIILKFCYGLPLDLNPNNIAALRCASEFLEMSEELEDGNLISKTEAFLTFVVLSSWKDTITVLKSCETLSPWAENLQIVRRCCDSIAWKASRDNSTVHNIINEEGWWFDDVATLRTDHFMRIVTAVRAKGAKPEITGKCIMHYASRWLPGMDVELEGLRGYRYGKNELQFGILCGRNKDEGVGHSKEQKNIIESIVRLLPPQPEAVPCKFLLKMLKMAIVYSASPALISELEMRVGLTLENASVNDLLIPNYKTEDQVKTMKHPEHCVMYNIEVVQRIVEYFLMHEQEQQQLQPMSGKSNVSKLMDNYLAEIARDPNLSITKFQVLAEVLPENARTCDDGLYRSIDTYLKTHPSLSEHDRKRLCKVMNCEKLSLDACMHAAQNDRLPMRTVIQVLFSEQVKMREAMRGKEPAASGNNSEQEVSQTSTKAEIMTLKTELENVKAKMAELQRDYSELQHEYVKINSKQRHLPGWSFNWKKIRKSSLFSRKTEAEETSEGQQRSNPLISKINFRRRQSIS